jgi:hypothetical protein
MEIQNGAVAKSHMRKGFLTYVEMCKYLTIYPYEEAVSHMYDFATAPFLTFLIYEEHLIFFFISAFAAGFYEIQRALVDLQPREGEQGGAHPLQELHRRQEGGRYRRH